jgi:hypothetical protein
MVADGVEVSEYKVRSICHKYQIHSNVKHKSAKYNKSKTVQDDLAKRGFTELFGHNPDVHAPNKVWFYGHLNLQNFLDTIR